MKEAKETMKGRAGKVAAVAAAGMIATSGIIAVAPMANADPTTFAENAVPIRKVINADPGVDTANIVYTFSFSPAAAAYTDTPVVDNNGYQIYEDENEVRFVYDDENYVAYTPGNMGDPENIVAGVSPAGANPVTTRTYEEGAFAVPAGASISPVHLTAAAMSGATQTLDGTIPLPDADLFGHAGVYAFTVTESVSDGTANVDADSNNVDDADGVTGWTNSQAQYKLRLYVINNPYYGGTAGVDGVPANADTTSQLVYDTDAVTIEQLRDDANSANFSPVKVDRATFTNTYTAVQDLEVQKLVSGDFADQTHEFNFAMSITVPDWYTGNSISYEDGSGNTLGSITLTNHQGSIASFDLHHTEKIVLKNLPVGTSYSVSETESNADAQNHYTPSATFTYAGTGDTTDPTDTTATKTNSVSVSGSAHEITVNVPAEVEGNPIALNQQTKVGAASGNKVVVTNTHATVTPTGIALQAIPYGLLIGGSLAGIYAIRMVNRRKKDID